jgi:hypothetical protein
MDPLQCEESLLERAAERADTAHTMFMLMDSNADGHVAIEQVLTPPLRSSAFKHPKQPFCLPEPAE